MALVAGTYGVLLRIDLEEDVSGYSGVALTITPPAGPAVTRTPAVGSQDVVEGGVTLPAQTYVEYPTVLGDFTAPGRYTLQVQVDFGAPKRLKTVSKMIEVMA
jgi:hypothetical protein